MSDHHIRIAFAVAGQAAFIFMYLMAIKETSRFKKNYVAWFGGFTWILFLFAMNCFAMKEFIEHDREMTRQEKALAFANWQAIKESEANKKKIELHFIQWQVETERGLEAYKYELDAIREKNRAVKSSLDKYRKRIKNQKHISTPATLIPPTFRAKNPDSLKHQEHLPLFNTDVK